MTVKKHYNQRYVRPNSVLVIKLQLENVLTDKLEVSGKSESTFSSTSGLSYDFINLQPLTINHDAKNGHNLVIIFQKCAFKISNSYFLLIILVFFQINGLGRHDTEQHGLWIDVRESINPWYATMGEYSGYVYLITAFFCPFIQSFYETYKNKRTHKLLVIIRDNRRALD